MPQTGHVRGLSLNRQQSLKVVIVGGKQCEQLRTLNAPQTNNGMRDSMHASAVRAVFSLLLLTNFELRYRCTSTHLRISFMEFNFQFFSVNLEIILQNVTLRKNSDVQMQNSNLKFDIMSISYM